MKIILLNGPPRSGKNTCAALLQNHLGADQCAVIAFAEHLKRMTHSIYGLPPETDPEAFDAVKDTSNPLFFGLSPRQAYIWWSEKGAKVAHGKEFFAKMWLRRAQAAKTDYVVVPDSGFREEAEFVVNEFDAKNVLLVHLHRTGTSFEGDSRSRVDLSDLNVLTWQVYNTAERPDNMLWGVLDGMRWAFDPTLKYLAGRSDEDAVA